MEAQAPRRKPTQTRDHLVAAAFAEIYHNGFQGSDLNGILHRAGVTRGALYHHFGSKEGLGHAVIEQAISGITTEKWLAPLDDIDDPIDALIGIIGETRLDAEAVSGGCPLNNLAQEMSPLDEGFRLRLAQIFAGWIGGVADALHLGQINGKVRRDIDAHDTATFFIATYEGYISLAKNAQSPDLLASGIRQLRTWLESLRP
ncbi:TetR/AcrR family transcriptional regulator [Asticcacaulis sp. EMRT-3]|uniref:TetR/AcrR family transcriptional regulator n=1 Tax=Asticcacaulis sp. EMRT-3 TaxID=3040349 RepID=UPI0024AF0639|nr:TetR/AcrR family transcriptional regulator [Asticcacaulis sp. EMRT-3]MDI7774998.1 TetR/AcrR family transcriptional regulator [Asticcacaulis sp. EMRT-3]